jgi:predicted nuclease with TOPRIM domain
MSELTKVDTQTLLYELYDRLDDNLYALERRYDPYLDSIERVEKQTLCQSLRVIYEDYK